MENPLQILKLKSMPIEDILNGLTEEEKEELRNRLGININIFLCGSVAVNSGISIQVNDPDSVKTAFEKIPPDSLAKILHAIADVIAKRKV